MAFDIEAPRRGPTRRPARRGVRRRAVTPRPAHVSTLRRSPAQPATPVQFPDSAEPMLGRDWLEGWARIYRPDWTPA